MRFRTPVRPAVLIALWLAGCASVEHRELELVERDSGVHVVEVLNELHLAIAAIDRFMRHEGETERLDLIFAEAKATLVTSHVDTGDERVALVLPAGDVRQRDAATSTLTLTLNPAPPLSAMPGTRPETEDRMQDLSALYASAERVCGPAAEKRIIVPAPPTRKRLWEAVAQVTMSALAGYRCAHHHVGGVATRLGELQLEIDVSAERDETGGLVLTLGQVGVGASESAENRRENKLLLTFRAP